MANAKAQSEKEKGNTAFQARDYPTAIGHYTAAILADRSDHTFPLNRAAAYLKLGKNEDAERDCTSVLSLSAHNVKALFRRAQARTGMGKLEDALSDLTQVSKREPANESVKEELKKVNELLQTRKKKASKVQAENASSTSSATRRRVPITIIEPPVETNSSPNSTRENQTKSRTQETSPSVVPQKVQANNSDSLTPVSTRSLKPTQVHQAQKPSRTESSEPSVTATTRTGSESSIPPPEKSEQPRSFKEAKQARDSGKPSRVGGGIFRASGENTVFPARNGTASSSMPNGNESEATSQLSTASGSLEKKKGEGSKVLAVTPTKPPATLFDFTRAWESASSLAEMWGIILSVPPATIPTLFKTSLEPALLMGIISVFRDVLVESRDFVGTVGEYMDAFTRVQRMQTVVMFLSRKEKAVVRECWEALGRGKEDTGKVWMSIWE